MEELNIWIHCRILCESSRNLLNYQELVLKSKANASNMNIVGISKDIYHGKDLNSYGFQKMKNYIQLEKIDLIQVYSEKCISIFEDVYEEFVMFCEQHNIRIITLKDLQFNFLFKSWKL